MSDASYWVTLAALFGGLVATFVDCVKTKMKVATLQKLLETQEVLHLDEMKALVAQQGQWTMVSIGPTGCPGPTGPTGPTGPPPTRKEVALARAELVALQGDLLMGQANETLARTGDLKAKIEEIGLRLQRLQGRVEPPPPETKLM